MSSIHNFISNTTTKNAATIRTLKAHWRVKQGCSVFDSSFCKKVVLCIQIAHRWKVLAHNEFKKQIRKLIYGSSILFTIPNLKCKLSLKYCFQNKTFCIRVTTKKAILLNIRCSVLSMEYFIKFLQTFTLFIIATTLYYICGIKRIENWFQYLYSVTL